MNCPSCGIMVPAQAKECPSCGVDFAKWNKREARRAQESNQDRAEAATADSAVWSRAMKAVRSDPMMGRKIAAAFVVGWVLLGLVYAMSRRRTHRREPPGTPTGEFAEMRDPKTGDMVRMPIRRLK